MLRNFQKESILLSPQRSPIVDSPAPSKSPCRNANPDIDFNDVFGGPPRRASLQNARRSFGEDPFGGDDDTTTPSSRNRWSGLYEKPVFGEHEGGTSNRVRYQAGDFFDDIFGGNDSLGSSSPRRIINGSPASSRVLSPARPLPARADPLGSSSSLPAPFSLPSKLTKGGTDLPTFGSNSRSYIKGKESGPSSSMISSNYSFSPLSRSSSKQDLVETEADELSMAKQHPDVTFQNPKGGGSQVKSSGGGGHFHFSIYKWASHGAPPLSKPLRGGSRSRDNKYTSSSASEVSVEPEITTVEEVKQPDSEYLKPLRSTILSDSDSERGSGTGERAREKDLREIKGVKSSSKVSALFNASHRKPEAELEEETQGKSKAKGKVKDFVKIFNLQEATPDVKDQMQRRSTKKERRNSRAMDDDIKVANEKMKLAPEDKNINLNASYVQVLPQVAVDQIEKQPAVERSNSYRCYEAEGISVAPAEVSDASEATVGDPDEPFQVRELPQQIEDEKQLPAGDNSEELQANDAKIRKWCQGKEGNIRSLLSTLQYILWKGSGWKPVALVDIIEGNAVKRTYQRALLCLHPDKLQQKGATGEQKFIAEKVFDILQEAWIHFNSLGSVV